MIPSTTRRSHERVRWAIAPQLGLAFALVAALTAGGCSSDQPVSEDGSGAPLGVPQIATSEAGIELAGQLPATVPVPRGAVPISLVDHGVDGAEVGFLANGRPGALKDWYAEELAGNGWAVQQQTDDTNGATIVARKGTESLLVLIAPPDPNNPRQVTIMVGYDSVAQQ